MNNYIVLSFVSMTLLFSCANINDPFSDAGENGNFIFPHSDDIEQGLVHRDLVQANGMSVCFACHRSQGSAGGPRSCSECHAEGFAHSSPTFGSPDEHSSVAIQAGPMNMCVTCHGITLRGGIGPSCYLAGCHAGSPYPHNIANYSNSHRSVTGQSDFPICLNCHERNTALAKGIVACADCHHNGDKNCLSCHPNDGDD